MLRKQLIFEQNKNVLLHVFIYFIYLVIIIGCFPLIAEIRATIPISLIPSKTTQITWH